MEKSPPDDAACRPLAEISPLQSTFGGLPVEMTRSTGVTYEDEPHPLSSVHAAFMAWLILAVRATIVLLSLLQSWRTSNPSRSPGWHPGLYSTAPSVL